MQNQPAKPYIRQRSISVLVPVLNEAENLQPTVLRLIEALTITIEDYEIIIVNDGSTDNTAAVADELARQNAAIRVLHNPRNMGLGYSYARGHEEARKEFFVYIPGDNTWPYRSFVELFGNLGRADIITSYAINPEVRPGGRRIVSQAYTRVLNLLFGHQLNYFNGLTIYPVEFLRRRPATTFGFGFQAEVLLKALTSGLSYIQVGLPIDERTAGGSKAVTLKNITSVAITILRVLWEIKVERKWRPGAMEGVGAAVLPDALSVDELGFEPDQQFASALSNATESKAAFVAGASSGIGHAIAISLADAGHNVFVCARSAERLEQAFSGRSDIRTFVCDVSDEQSVKALAASVAEQTSVLDVLINCAGGFGAIGSIDQVDSEDWRNTFNTNLFGAFLTIKHFLPLLEKSKAAQILNFSGGGAFSAFPNFSAYACSKAALVRLTETLAVELSPRGIAVNAIAPGVLPTKAHEATIAAGEKKAGTLQYRRAQRLLEQMAAPPEQPRMEAVQNCVKALISPEYSGLTGKTISANFDPWSTSAFRRHLRDITRSELYTMQRTNLVHLPNGLLKSALMKVWAKYRIRR